jgi:phage shock protein A
MASVLGRVSTISKAKVHSTVHSALDVLEDPDEILRHSYAQQQELLRKVHEGLTVVVAARSRLQIQLGRLRQESATLEMHARNALAAGREDLARMALTRKSLLAPQIQSLQRQVETLDTQQQALQTGARQLAARVEALRLRTEALKAQRVAAQAHLAIGEAASGLSREMADAHGALRRAEERVERMQARAVAITDLTAAGTLPDTLGGDPLGAQLDQISAAAAIDAELAALKLQLGKGTARAQLGPGR